VFRDLLAIALVEIVDVEHGGRNAGKTHALGRITENG
jgi:hypothetical protein